MRSLLSHHIFPFLIAVTIVLILYVGTGLPGKVSALTGEADDESRTNSTEAYIPAIRNNPVNEARIRQALRSDGLVILGSSELSERSSAVPYRFLPASYRYPVLGAGHAGYQSMAMLATLGSMTAELRDANLLVILSPGWFEDYSSGGTSVELFLENMSDGMLREIIVNQGLPDTYRQYIADYIAGRITHIQGASAAYRYLYHTSAAGNNLLFRIVHYPFLAFNGWLLNAGISAWPGSDSLAVPVPDEYTTFGLPEDADVMGQAPDWDSLLAGSVLESASRATNNTWGIDDEYYTKYIRGGTGHIKPVSPEHNRELRDFGMLVGLLKASGTHAGFVIQPLNPYYFTELPRLQPVIDAITDTIARAGFPCLDLFEADSSRYNKALLRDVMHMDDYGWYLVNRFIVAHYADRNKTGTYD